MAIHFKQTTDLQNLSTNDPAYPVVKELIEQLISAYSDENGNYNYQDYGWIVLLQEGDLDKPLDIWHDGTTFLDLDYLLEAVVLERSMYVATVLVNNESGFIFVLDSRAEWLTPEVCDMLERHLETAEI